MNMYVYNIKYNFYLIYTIYCTLPIYVASNCGHPGIVAHGAASFGGTSVGWTANFTCNKGYMMTSGSEMRTCQTNGIWSGILPVCSGTVKNNILYFYNFAKDSTIYILFGFGIIISYIM